VTCREDGTYNIEFDDKEIFKEFKVPVSRIRKVSDIGERERERERLGDMEGCHIVAVSNRSSLISFLSFLYPPSNLFSSHVNSILACRKL
jgi:hypothetical protein